MLNKGKTGSWRNQFTPSMVEQFEKWEAKWLKDSDLKLEYDI